MSDNVEDEGGGGRSYWWDFFGISIFVVAMYLAFGQTSPEDLVESAETYYEVQQDCLEEMVENKTKRPGEIRDCRIYYSAKIKLSQQSPEHLTAFLREAIDEGVSYKSMSDEVKKFSPTLIKAATSGSQEAKQVLADLEKVRLKNPG